MSKDMRKWTPGDWKRGHTHGDEFPNHTTIRSEMGLNSNGIMRIKTLAYIPKRGTPEETEHDAHLIAAAPELYEALEAFTDDSDCHDEVEWFNERLREARDALAKARGEA